MRKSVLADICPGAGFCTLLSMSLSPPSYSTQAAEGESVPAIVWTTRRAHTSSIKLKPIS